MYQNRNYGALNAKGNYTFWMMTIYGIKIALRCIAKILNQKRSIMYG